MGGHPKRPEPQLARTDFESMTHEQLAAMLESASTSGASHLSTKLSKAASTISKIGDDLMKHVKDLEWQGEGGDAFRDWGGQTAGATLRLGQYAEVASRWMGTVSQAISEAKAAMPDTSETTQAKKDLSNAHATIAAAKEPGAHNDPDAQKLAQTARTDASSAQQRIDAARGEAIQQMRKLAQTYEFSAQEVNSVPPPTFSPPADHLDSKEWFGDLDHISAGSSGSGTPSRTATGAHADTSVSGHHGTALPDAAHATSRSVPAHATAPDVTSRDVLPSRPVDMEIDGAGTLPHPASPSPAGPNAPEPGLPHRGLPPSGQTDLPPVASSGQRVPTPSPLPRLPLPSQLPQAGSPKGTAMGRVPGMPRETGIIGGRPVTAGPGRPQNNLPRGTVIGNENVQGRTGAAGVPRGGATGAPAGGTPGSARGSSGGRRLASETGGVIGSRQNQPSRASGRPFTPGGSGLVRRSSESTSPTRRSPTGRTGAVGPSSQSRESREEGQGLRPDYLVEDEETWASLTPRAVPPVVE